MFVFVGGEEDIGAGGGQVPAVDGADSDAAVCALVGAVGGGEHPVGSDQRATAQHRVVDANCHLVRQLAARRRLPAHDLLVDQRCAGAFVCKDYGKGEIEADWPIFKQI